MMSGYDMNGWGWAGMAAMAFAAIAIVALIAWAIARRPGESQRPQASARSQLDARLASGAIDAPEYRERLAALTGAGPRPRER
jgi:HAMP domain-containing protein